MHVGAGGKSLKGWLNTDFAPISLSVVPLDITKPFPFSAETFHYIYSEHMIEHLSYNNGIFMLRECFRVLRPAGRIRIATPDLRVIVGLFAAEKTSEQRRYIQSMLDNSLPKLGVRHECFVLNYMVHNGHEFVYDAETLQSAIESCGFCNVRFCRTSESDEMHLRGLETRADQDNRFETMILEASKPKLVSQ